MSASSTNLNLDIDTTNTHIPESLSLAPNSIGSEIPAPKSSKPDLGQIKRQQRRARMEAGFDLWKATGHIDPLLKVVIEYTQNKLKKLEFDDGFKGIGTAETVDDWSQDVSIKIWKLLAEGKFKGTTFASFLKLLNVACKNRNSDAFEYLKDERETYVGIMTPIKDDFGGNSGEEQDNPDIYNSGEYPVTFTIPLSIQGRDLLICKLILAGMNHAQIAEDLQMSEPAVSQRMSRMRKQVAKDRQAIRAKHEAEKHEQKTGFDRGITAFRKLNGVKRRDEQTTAQEVTN